MAQEKVLLADNRRSKNSFFPKFILAAVMGFSLGTGTLGKPNGG